MRDVCFDGGNSVDFGLSRMEMFSPIVRFTCM